jgi:hypothetical protein
MKSIVERKGVSLTETARSLDFINNYCNYSDINYWDDTQKCRHNKCFDRVGRGDYQFSDVFALYCLWKTKTCFLYSRLELLKENFPS